MTRIRRTANAIKAFTMVLLVTLVFSNAMAKMPSAFEQNPEIAVIAVFSQSDFVPDRTGASPSVGFPDALADRVLENLSRSRRFLPVEREALRRVINEQRFEQRLAETYLDQTLNKAISKLDTMESVGDGVVGTRMTINLGMGGMEMQNALTPEPVGGGLSEGSGKIGTAGALSNFNDILKDFLDLGTAAGTDFIVFGSLEPLDRESSSVPVPYSGSRSETRNLIRAKARIRIIDTNNSMVIGAASFSTKIDESLFSGTQIGLDESIIYDALAGEIASEVIDMVFPARIATVNPVTITRGRNDLVSNGDTYTVLRVGKEIKDQDEVVLGTLTRTVGEITVSSIEDNFSLATVIKDDDIEVGDLVKRSSLKQAELSDDASITGVMQQPSINSARPTLAIGRIDFFSVRDSGKQSPQIFTDTLISSLTNTKRFDIVDRQELDQLLTEQEATLMKEGRSLPSAIGTLIGADYLALGTVSDLLMSEKELKIPGSSQVFTQVSGVVEGNIRITDVNTGVVLESRKISISRTLQAGVKGDFLVSQLADDFSRTAVQTILNAIYPFKIIAVSQDGTIYINRGKDGGFSEGDIFNVFRQGRAIVDPDSNRNMGYEESKVGKLSIIDVEDTRSKAVLLSGGPFASGYLVKAVSADQTEPTGAAQTKSKKTLSVGLMRMDQGMSANGITEAKLVYLSNVLIARLSESSDYKLVERLEIDNVLDQKAITSVIQNGGTASAISSLTPAAHILVGGITSMSFQNVARDLPYVDQVEVFHLGNIEGVFKIVDVASGEIVLAKTVTASRQFKPGINQEQVQNLLLRVYADEIVLALTDASIEQKKEVMSKPARQVVVPAW